MNASLCYKVNTYSENITQIAPEADCVILLKIILIFFLSLNYGVGYTDNKFKKN